VKFLSAIFIVILSVPVGQATVINVPGDQPTIQAGINAAVDGDTILVAPGTYDGVNPVETLSRIKLNTNPFTYRSASSQQADVANNADLLDGLNSTDFAANAHSHAPADVTPQGPGSTLDADLLDGLNSTDFAADAHGHAPADVTPQGSGSTLDADLLDGLNSTDFADFNHGHGAHNHDADYVNEAGDTLPPAGLTLYRTDGSPGIRVRPEPGLIESFGTDGLLNARLGNQSWGELSLHNMRVTNDKTAILTAGFDFGGALFLRDSIGANSIVMTGGQPGDFSVQFPDDAINSAEILDEPGIASQTDPTGVDQALTSTMTDIETVTITIPTSGYIYVTGNVYSWITGNPGDAAVGQFQIDETAGGSAVFPHYRNNGMYFKNSFTSFHPVYVDRVYFKSAGTYTFRIEGRELIASGIGNVNSIWPRLTAMFIPTSYGAVATSIPLAESGEFDNVHRVMPGESAGGIDLGSESQVEMVSVDLRELELKVARAKAETEKAKRELLEAQLQLGQP